MTYFDAQPNDIFRRPTKLYILSPHQMIYHDTRPNRCRTYVKPDEMTYFDVDPDQMIYFDAPPNDIFGRLTKSHIWMADKVIYFDAQRNGIF